ncbi:MAG: hypothetical protein GX801_09025 [Fibrobacter sp.]|nr:hypothetical protein [Fibrobacter sp.]
MKRLISLLFIGFSLTLAQPSLPILVGANLEFASGLAPLQGSESALLRINPYLGFWLPNYVYGKFVWGQWGGTQTNSGKTTENRQRILGGSIAASVYNKAPYLLVSANRVQNYNTLGDASWWEWGLGLGFPVMISDYASIIAEIQHKTINEFYDAVSKKNIKSKGFTFSLGMQSYVF